jgi:hypothetical protein
MVKFRPEDLTPGQEPAHAENKEQQEGRWPIITFKERQLFEEAGGKYRGFVDTSDGRKFEEFWVGRRAYYDPEERKILETYVETTATDGEESELEGPEEVSGYEVLIVKRDSHSHEVGKPLVIDLYSRNFPGQRFRTNELRALAVQVHDFLLRNTEAPLKELARKAEAFLQQKGWQGKAY